MVGRRENQSCCPMRTGVIRFCILSHAIIALMVLGVDQGFAAIASTEAAPNNPYQIIFSKNLFRLHPPVISAKQPPPVQPAATIILTGITTVLGEKRAFLEITP